jgi:hypothetical protein
VLRRRGILLRVRRRCSILLLRVRVRSCLRVYRIVWWVTRGSHVRASVRRSGICHGCDGVHWKRTSNGVAVTEVGCGLEVDVREWQRSGS